MTFLRYLLPLLLIFNVFTVQTSAQVGDRLPPAEGIKPEVKPNENPRAVLFAKAVRGVVRIDIVHKDAKFFGTGFLIGRSGLIVTNYHVIEGAISGKVTFHDGTTKDITGAVAYDKKQDIALLMVPFSDEDATKFPLLKLAEQNPQVGIDVITIGNPQGLSNSLSSGIVSNVLKGGDLAKAFDDVVGGWRNIQLYVNVADNNNQWIQTTAAISGGNSGGPLISMDGLVVGVNTLGWHKGQNLNFAASVEKVKALIAEAAPEPMALRKITEKEFGKVPTQEEIVRRNPRINVSIDDDWKPKRRYTRNQVLAQVGLTIKNLECRECVGKGTQDVRVTHRNSSILGGGVDHIEKRPCPVCQGTGKFSSHATFLQAANLAEKAMLMKGTEDIIVETQRTARETLDAVALNRGSSAALCNKMAGRLLDNGEKSKGKPTVFYGFVFLQITNDKEGSIYACWLHEADQPVFIRSTQRLVYSKWYLISGIVTGITTIAIENNAYQYPGVEAFAVSDVR